MVDDLHAYEHETVGRQAFLPWRFAYLYADLVMLARNVGYSLALHGSMARDLDLIAVPWTDDAVSAQDLAHVIAEGTGRALSDFHEKPHGRLAWVIQLGGGPYIDLSVMPRVESKPEAQGECAECGGNGIDPLVPSHPCPACHGTGKVTP